MHKSLLRATTAILSGIVMAAALLWLGSAATVQANGTTRYVATTGTDASNDCSVPGSPCATIQHAIDQASSGDEIRVADGTYVNSGTVAEITQAVTITGAYDPAFTARNPDLYETILDAQWGGSVISMSNASQVALQYLTITHGDGTGNCGSRGCGGGIYSYQTDLHVGHCTVEDNIGNSGGSATENYGGGIYSADGDVEIWKSRIVSNTANTYALSPVNGRGGGVYITLGTAVLRENHILDNLGNAVNGVGFGGGIYLDDLSRVELLTNTIRENRANEFGSTTGSYGGGIYQKDSLDSLIAGNHIEGNWSKGRGGGVYIDRGQAHLASNVIISNATAGSPGTGGGVNIWADLPITLTNNLLAQNTATSGGGVYIYGNALPDSKALLVNNTIADNGDSGILVRVYNLITVTNNIISGHTEGITTTASFTGTINAENNLFSNTSDTIVGDKVTYGDPLFMPGYGYHLHHDSPAIDKGATIAWLDTDLDGRPRPQGDKYDLGAYEGGWWGVRLPLVMRRY